MIEKLTYDWPEEEDDNIDIKAREKAKSMTIEEIDKDLEEFLSNFELEDA